MTAARTLASVWAAKTTAFASRKLRRGGGTAAGGLVALWLNPGLIGDIAAQLGHGSVVVTGTNGKTTTSLLISETARAAGLLPLANASGSNLTRGIASALALAVDADGGLDEAERRLGVFEVDEATIAPALPQLHPASPCSRTCFATSSTATARSRPSPHSGATLSRQRHPT